ncbi:Glycolipid anchored surface protein 4 precursor [Coniosporium apollinis]|uniref:1,3-beta-glucanosyltransferase n=1 Tax=Coniosporium apollinis TaxID=61459 RepID=A0ABQ9P4N6_9PEZI|nr:Glycolipid anchored surface protein 4 precursor [Coniosporium apollinis]
MALLRTFTALLASCAAIVSAVNPIEVRSQNFVDARTNERLMIIGVDYQPGGQGGYKPQEGQDALTNGTVCLRDAALMQRLGVNTIRVYNVDPTLNHDECASIFNAVGIYMIIDVNSPFGGESLDRSNPSGSYTLGYLERTFRVVENFKNYPNTLGFFSANEVMNDVGTSSDNPPYIRAIQRDLKRYIAAHADRTIPVGYSAADVREILADQWNYFQCAISGERADSRSDFFGLNSYSWCGGDATFQTAGYNVLVDLFGNTTVPVFFSEYGCNEVQPRVFEEVQALYGPEMSVMSGGLVYEYSQEESDYGLVVVNPDGTIRLRQDFGNLQDQLNQINITLVQTANSTATTLRPPTCDESLITFPQFSKSFDIPDAPEGLDDVISNGVRDAVQGRIVDVTARRVPMAVLDVNGASIDGLEIVPVPQGESNTPSGENTGGDATGTATEAAPSATSSAAAVENGVRAGFLGLALGLAAVVVV